MDTLQTYDELPYDSWPLPETQPDFLAAVALLHGYVAPNPHRARVLELGCASGGNLIPLAFHHPDLACIGIELSRLQADAGARFIDELGLGNVRILHADLAALPDDLGMFDYIIAHGVFSWVPPTVQQALLRVCRDHLTPHGLAYISFNVSVGWRHLLPLRETLLSSTNAQLPASQRVAQARDLLENLNAANTEPMLMREIAHLKTAAPSYLFHEFLAEYNSPMSFTQFASQLENAGLQYVAEAGPRRAIVELDHGGALTPPELAKRWLEAESALDELLQTRFRRAVVSRADAPSACPPQANQLLDLTFYGDLSSDAEIDLDTNSDQEFINAAGNRFNVSHPLLKAALMALSAAYPAALGYMDMLKAANEVMTHFEASGTRNESSFRDALLNLLNVHGVLPTLESSQALAISESQPQAHALARMQAASPGWTVSGARQVGLGLDESGRALLSMLDGTQTVDQLTLQMQSVLQGQGMEMNTDEIQQLVEQQLALFARQGLLHGMT